MKSLFSFALCVLFLVSKADHIRTSSSGIKKEGKLRDAALSLAQSGIPTGRSISRILRHLSLQSSHQDTHSSTSSPKLNGLSNSDRSLSSTRNLDEIGASILGAPVAQQISNSCRLDALDILRTEKLQDACNDRLCHSTQLGVFELNSSSLLHATPYLLQAVVGTSSDVNTGAVGCALQHACHNISIPLDVPAIPERLRHCQYLQQLLSGQSPVQRRDIESPRCLVSPGMQADWLYSQISANLTSTELTLGEFCSALSVSRHSWRVQAASKAAGGHGASLALPDRKRWGRAMNFSAPFSANTCERDAFGTTPLFAEALEALRKHPGCAVFASIMVDSNFDFIVASSTCSSSECAAVLKKTAQNFQQTIESGNACQEDIEVLSFLTNMCISAEGKPSTELCTVPILAAELLYALRADFTVAQLLQPDVELGEPPNIVSQSTNIVITRELLNIACDQSCVTPIVASFRELAHVHPSYRLKAEMFLFLCSKSSDEHDQYCMVEQDSRQSANGPSATIEIPDPSSNLATPPLIEHPNPELLAFELFATFPGQSQRMCTHCAHNRMQSFMQAVEIVAMIHTTDVQGMIDFAERELSLLNPNSALPAGEWLQALQSGWEEVPFSLQSRGKIVVDVIMAATQGVTDIVRLLSTTMATQSLDDLVCRDQGLEALAERPRCVDAWGVFNHLNVQLWSYSPLSLPKRCTQPAGLAECVRYQPNIGRGALQDTCQDCCHAQSLHWLARAQFVLGQILQYPGVSAQVADLCVVIERLEESELWTAQNAAHVQKLAKFCLESKQAIAKATLSGTSVSTALLAGPGVANAQESCLAPTPRPQACDERQTCSAEFVLGDGVEAITQSESLRSELINSIVTDVRFATGLPADQMSVTLLREEVQDGKPTTIVSITLQSFVQKTCQKRLDFIVDVVGSQNGVHLFETKKTLQSWAEAGWWVPAAGNGGGTEIFLRVSPKKDEETSTSEQGITNFPILPVASGLAGCLAAVGGALWYAKSVKKKRVFTQP